MPSDTPARHSSLQEQLRAISENDEAALRQFYQNNYKKTERYVLDNSGTADEAKDVYQEAFVAVWRAVCLGRFQPRHDTSLDAYLYQIAKNKWLDRLRTARRQPVVPLTEGAAGLEAAPDLSQQEEQQLQAIKANLKKLGHPCQEVLERFYYHRQSIRTISEALNWTEATAKNNKYRCLQRLREFLKTNTPNLE